MRTFADIKLLTIETSEIEAGVRKGQQLRAEYISGFFRSLFKGVSPKARHDATPAGTVGGAA
ncbi:hypothetical protein [uncultured Thalassospira sp.]|jgi:hypothetical protein|uniref:hypothetical protein n=1 Tax=uncultured Thalassospira sp. TaxID=404382 RepID=UPI0030D930E6|tara:strand:+ start:1554 stop:1739 length:186 start_codon:yes stop_codon:yes gene_type:complete